MLPANYRFKMATEDWMHVSSQLKGVVCACDILLRSPLKHNRRMVLLVVAELRALSQRIDMRVVAGRPRLSIQWKQAEALAFILAVQNRWIEPNHANYEIIETIDRAA